MQLLNDSVLIISSIILGAIGIYTLKHRKVPGAYPLFIQMTVAVIWTWGSFLELNSSTLEAKLLWRNIQQIGVFLAPVTNVFFAMDYTNNKNLKKFRYLLAMIPIVALILIFTNEYHHLMRSAYDLIDKGLVTKSLVVKSTGLGLLFIGFNYSFQILAIVILFDFARRISSKFRNRVHLVIGSILLTLVLSWLRIIYLQQNGIYIPIAVLYVPSGIILFYSVFKHRLFNISPIARDKVFDIIGEGIMVVDEEGKIVDVNRHAVYLLENVLSINRDVVGMELAEAFKNIGQIPEMFYSIIGEFREIHLDNNSRESYLSISKHTLSSHKGTNKIGAVFIINDITDKKIYELSLKARADSDGLTGLLNRNGFADKFPKMVSCEECKHQPIAAFMMDIDFFKKINDTYGHINGDKVLHHFATKLKKTLGEECIIGRIGGEEFAVILPGIDKYKAFDIAEDIRIKVEESNIEIAEGKSINYTVSIGIADNNGIGINQERLLHNADEALYDAKKLSRNCTIIYNKS